MVKGMTRQVIWIKGSGEKLFEQAIFLVRDDVLSQGGITEEELLKEARAVCTQKNVPFHIRSKLLWIAIGALGTALCWLFVSFVQ